MRWDRVRPRQQRPRLHPRTSPHTQIAPSRTKTRRTNKTVTRTAAELLQSAQHPRRVLQLPRLKHTVVQCLSTVRRWQSHDGLYDLCRLPPLQQLLPTQTIHPSYLPRTNQLQTQQYLSQTSLRPTHHEEDIRIGRIRRNFQLHGVHGVAGCQVLQLQPLY